MSQEKIYQVRADSSMQWWEVPQADQESMVNNCGWQGRVLFTAPEPAPAAPMASVKGSSTVEMVEAARRFTVDYYKIKKGTTYELPSAAYFIGLFKAMQGAAPAPATPAVSVDTAEFRLMLGEYFLSCEDTEALNNEVRIIAHIDAHTARAVAAEYRKGFSEGAKLIEAVTGERDAARNQLASVQAAAPRQHAQAAQPATAPDFSEQYTQGYTVGHAEGYASCARRMAVDERASFEAWIIAAFDECGEDEPNLDLDKNGLYTNDMRVLTGWQIWQARANLAAPSPVQREMKL